jgi:MATE family multidrug resistance protein
MNLSLRTEIKDSLRLSIPLAGAQISQAATGFVDTVMMGWLGQETLAGGGLAAITFTTLLVTATGIVLGASPLVAEAFGAGSHGRIQKLMGHGIWISVLVSLPVMMILGNMHLLMGYLGQTAATISIFKTFLGITLWGFLPALLFALLKSVISSLSHPQPIMGIVVFGTLFNAIANYILGFGKFGFPALGVVGIAWASAISQWLILMIAIAYILLEPELRTYRLFSKLNQLELKTLVDLMAIGIPISISFALEIGLFTSTTYLMGALGTEVLAAHQMVFQTIALIFMVPLGMSFATTIRVGQWLGQHNWQGIQQSAYVGMGLGGIFMVGMAIALSIFPRQVFSLYLDVNNSDNLPAISLATSMMAIAALSQILDGVQTNIAGALRGLQDTRIPMVISFVAFWGVGLSSGYILGFWLGWGGVGLWIGQLLGVATAAVLFLWRWQKLAIALANQV